MCLARSSPTRRPPSLRSLRSARTKKSGAGVIEALSRGRSLPVLSPPMPDYDAFTYDVVDRFDVAWQQGFRHFLEVPTNRAGKRIVTTTHTTPDGFQLGKWQNRQRQLWKSGKLEAKREKALLLAGMVWDTKEALWEEGLEEFAALEPDAKGHRAATQKFVTPEGFKLGAWIHTQRTNYAKVPTPTPLPTPVTPPTSPTPPG